MKRRACAMLAALATVATSAGAQLSEEMKAAMARWELLRASPDMRLSIDPKSLKGAAGQSTFKYLIDFRQAQGEAGGKYRSIVVGAKLQCKERRIALDTFELYTGATATGILLAQPQPSAQEKRFQPIAKGSSDEELFERVCARGGAARK